MLGVSGGVDSSVSAALLRDAGYEVRCALLIMSGHTDAAPAIAAAETLGLPLDIIDCRAEFESIVVRDLVSEYCRGRTPNPCVRCNSDVKFAALARHADSLGIKYIATGHYADVGLEDGRYHICRSPGSLQKEQSYVLWRLGEGLLPRLKLPLAGYDKDEVRRLARELGLNSADAPDSQEICFIPDRDYAAYVRSRALSSPEYAAACTPGRILDSSGRTIGEHEGIIHYTVGQRKGIGAWGRPAFVLAIDADANTITLGFSGDEYGSRLRVGGLNFQLLPPMKEGELRCEVKIRYAAPPVPALVRFYNEHAEILFDQLVRAIAPGQSAVCYDGGRILFGGVIGR